MSKLKIVLDTNAVLSATFPNSKFQIILRCLANDVYDLFITTEIMLEYEEKLIEIFNKGTSVRFLELCHTLPNVQMTEIYYGWQLIHADPDDDKFVDCAVSANADYLVTNDKHYNILKNIPFPNLKVIRIEEFMDIVSNSLQSYPI